MRGPGCRPGWAAPRTGHDPYSLTLRGVLIFSGSMTRMIRPSGPIVRP